VSAEKYELEAGSRDSAVHDENYNIYAKQPNNNEIIATFQSLFAEQ
jgi:hypothetical protein